MCNQAAGLSRCLTRVQDSMNSQLKTLRLDSKGKSSEKVKQAVSELEYLTTSTGQYLKQWQDLSEAVFINMENFTLARRDSYLDYLHAGVKATSHHTDKKSIPAWKQIKDNQQARKGRGKASTFSQKPAKGFKSHK